MDDPMLQRLRRSPFAGGFDASSVFGQLDSMSSVPMSAIEDLGFTPEVAAQSVAGMMNSGFRIPPPDTSVAINDITNKIPGWSLVDNSAGKVTAQWVSGQIKWTVASGASGDEAYLEQVIPVFATAGRSFSYHPLTTWVTGGSSNGLYAFARGQYLKSDDTTTGSELENNATWSSIVSGTPMTVGSAGGSTFHNWTTPADAWYQRIRVGVYRNGASSSLTGTLYLAEVFERPGQIIFEVVDRTDPTQKPAWIFKENGSLLFGSTATVGNFITIDDTSVQLGGGLAMTGFGYASVTSNKNDYGPGNWQTLTTLVLDPDAARSITGFEAPADAVQGTTKVIYNISSAFAITLVHASGSSSSNNQIYGPNSANMTIAPRGGLTLMWFGDSGGAALRWRLVSGD